MTTQKTSEKYPRDVGKEDLEYCRSVNWDIFDLVPRTMESGKWHQLLQSTRPEIRSYQLAQHGLRGFQIEEVFRLNHYFLPYLNLTRQERSKGVELDDVINCSQRLE